MMTSKHTNRFHISRLILFAVLGMSILIARSEVTGSTSLAYNKEVLAYATAMGSYDLLSAANASRGANGLASLTMNGQLTNSAQAKAQHMVANNYWDHVAPDGTQPWYFFDQAGYVYAGAGENLAYGFNTGYEVNTAWMNSPAHQANILGDYQDVGFGIASSATYQGGENTVVVAHYGKPRVATPPPAPVPAPAPIAPTPPPASTPTPVDPAPVSTPVETPASPAETTTPVAETPTNTAEETREAEPTTNTAATANISDQTANKNVSALDMLRNGQPSAIIITSLSMVGTASAGFFITHRRMIRHLFASGKKFVLHHPLLDVTAVCLTAGLILSTTVGKLV